MEREKYVKCDTQMYENANNSNGYVFSVPIIYFEFRNHNSAYPNEIYIPSKTIFNMLFDKCWWWKLEREIELKIIWRIFLFEICNFVNVIPFWLYFLPHRTYAYDINCIFIDSTIIFRPAKPKSLKYITLSIKHTYLRGMKITKKSQNM